MALMSASGTVNVICWGDGGLQYIDTYYIHVHVQNDKYMNTIMNTNDSPCASMAIQTSNNPCFKPEKKIVIARKDDSP